MLEPISAIVRSPAELQQVIASAGGGPHYVYVLYRPGSKDSPPTPFYVGIGQGLRLFAHEEQARDANVHSLKVDVIRSLWSEGLEVVRMIDSVHKQEPWDREEQLINEIGRVSEGRGPLTNAQVYAPSKKVDGVELRKYAANHATASDLDVIPAKFKLRDVRLMAGPREPSSKTSVFGKIFAVAKANPGVTGEGLVRLLQVVDFTGNKSAYTQSGRVSTSWLVGYIEGGFFRSDRQHLQRFSE